MRVNAEEGGLTAGEMESLTDAAVDCMKDSGLQAWNYGIDPVNHTRAVYSFDLPVDGSVTEEEMFQIEEVCVAAYLADLPERFVNETEPYMAEDLLGFSVDCLESQGYQIDEGTIAMFQLVQAAPKGEEDVVVDCVSDGLLELYPDRPPNVRW